MQSSASFVTHCLDLLKGGGTTGHTGTASAKSLDPNVNVGTRRLCQAVPDILERSQPVSAVGTRKAEIHQSVTATGTSDTGGTALSEGTESQQSSWPQLSPSAVLPDDWREGFTRLSCADRLANFTATRWNDLIRDSAGFLNLWGEQAAKLGWTASDIFGVHPKAPSSRCDQMGVALLIHGGTIVAITDSTAVIKERSGSLLTWRRSVDRRSVPIWDLLVS
jgi:hypothetical protein